MKHSSPKKVNSSSSTPTLQAGHPPTKKIVSAGFGFVIITVVCEAGEDPVAP